MSCAEVRALAGHRPLIGVEIASRGTGRAVIAFRRYRALGMDAGGENARSRSRPTGAHEVFALSGGHVNPIFQALL